MKKIITLLSLIFCFTGILHSSAQNTACNAEFHTVYQNGNTIQFNSVMTGTAANIHHYWLFGDGATSNAVSPVHTYSTGPVFTVEHIIVVLDSNGAQTCMDSAYATVQVQIAACNLQAGFNTTILSTSPFTFHFQNASTPLNNVDSVRWTFGDGISSNDLNPNHTYSQPGTYIVCLRVQHYGSSGTVPCVSETCDSVVVPVPANCPLIVNFTWAPISSTNTNTFHFTNTSTPLNATDSIRWDFGDGTFSNNANPTHTFAQAGTYVVCLRIQERNPNGGLTNCVREVCYTIVVQMPTTCNLQASFYSYIDSILTIPNTYHLINTSTGLTNTDSIRWTFGDGTSSNQANPIHTYTQPGTYTVCLRISRITTPGTAPCVSEICHTIVVQGTPCNLVASFYSYQDTTSSTTNTYQFVNTSTPFNSIDSIRWTFGDGTSSNQANPIHTYTQPGTYTVCLRISHYTAPGTVPCVSEICHTIVVQGTPCNLVANFYSIHDTTSSTINTYQFVNTSTPLNAYDSIHWNFGDGTSSTQVNPIHTYAQPGTYTVCLRVQKRGPNAVGLTNCIREICHTVVVTAICNIQAHFTWYADSSNQQLIHFINQTISSTAGATATWTFGDGTSSTAWNPTHQYAQPGNYIVCLRVQLTANCVSYSCDSITIHQPVPNCMQQSNFTFVRATNNNELFYFTANYVNNSLQYTWTFGDGTGSQAPTASHQYAHPGNYTTCLTVYRDSSCASTTCRTVTALPQVNCNGIQVHYNFQHDAVVPNKLYFQAVSNYTLADQTWTITKLPASSGTSPIVLHQNNPSYIFHDSGYYNVCLRAVTQGGCVKEYCQVINIANVVAPSNCTLQVYPNPVTTQVSFNIFLTQPQMINVYIYNALNVQVKEKHQSGFAGTNMVSVPIADLVAGTYTLKVIHGNDICYAQFVKL